MPTAFIAPVALSVPQLALASPEEPLPFDETEWLDSDWTLARCEARLGEAEFPASPAIARLGELDVAAGGKIRYGLMAESQQARLALDGDEGGWSREKLADWLDRAFAHPDIPQAQSSLFIYNLLTFLAEERGLPLEHLARRKFQLARAIEALVERHRREERRRVLQLYLFGPRREALTVDPTVTVDLTEGTYSPNWYYHGRRRFKKHAFPTIGELKEAGEEFDCAVAIDETPEVEAWVRNISNRPRVSFWLPTTTDRFYPDFVAKLNDGRLLAVEYKNAADWSNDDSKEKRAVGALWAERSQGRCLFVMPKGRSDLGAIGTAISGGRS